MLKTIVGTLKTCFEKCRSHNTLCTGYYKIAVNLTKYNAMLKCNTVSEKIFIFMVSLTVQVIGSDVFKLFLEHETVENLFVLTYLEQPKSP